MSEIEKVKPSERELAIHAQLFRPNQHDRKHLADLGIGNKGEGRWFRSFGYKEIPKGTENVRLVSRGDFRFQEKFLGWVKIGDYDWIWAFEHPDGSLERYPSLHFQNYSASKQLNIVALDESHMTLKNPSQAAAFRAAIGDLTSENPFE